MSNQNISHCPSQGGESDPEHVNIAHAKRLAPIE